MIKFVYFDVGGVAIQDFSCTDKWHQMQLELGVTKEHQPAFNKLFGKLELQVCDGLDLDSVLPQFKKFGAKFPSNYSMTKDFVSRFKPNKHLWPIVDKLKQSNIKVGLLTNMYPRMLDLINECQLLPDHKWDAVIDSSKEKMSKPNPEIYHLAQKRAHTHATQILFIDNTQKNLDPAKSLDWHTFFYDSHNYQKSSQELEAYLKKELS